MSSKLLLVVSTFLPLVSLLPLERPDHVFSGEYLPYHRSPCFSSVALGVK